MSIHFQKCTIENLPQLRPIALTTFWDTYGTMNTPENIVSYLKSSFDESHLKKEINHPDSDFYLLQNDGQEVGYFKINTGAAQTESMPDNYLEIERIYILNTYHGKGFGRRMIDFIKEIAIAKRKNVIWLGVWEKNPKAIAFYERMGFNAFGKHEFVVGDEAQVDIMMKMELVT